MRPPFLRRLILIGMLLGAMLLGWLPPSDAPLTADRDESGPGVAIAQATDPADKLEGRLRVLAEAARAGRAPNRAETDQAGLTTDRGRVRVVVEATGGVRAGARVAAAGAARQTAGLVEAEYADLVQVLVPVDRLLDLAADPNVRYVRAPYAFAPRAVTGEGVQASGAAAWHAAGFNGTGVKVAVIDGGFTGLQDRIAQGDIPASAQLVDLCSGNVNATEHGTGVAEVVHEMAPGAQLILYCVGTEVQLGQAKDQAKAAGAHIVSMSLAWFNSSRGDGNGGPSTPEGIVADARQSGILWVNSAGNAAAGEAWNGPWLDVGNDGFLDWVSGDNTNSFTVGNGSQACAYLRWDSWPATAQDFALQIRDSANFASVLAEGDNPQNGTQRPVEQVCYTNNTGAQKVVDVVIRRVNATELPPRFDLNVFNQRLEHFKTDSNIDIPATSPSAFAVGAVCWQSERLEDYSSRGPTIDGRTKPDIAGQSVVSSGAYGPWQACPADSDGQGGFNGTSAAAPHVAGAAALVKSANPGFGPAEIQSLLESRARDKGPAGKDNQFGFGILTLGPPGAVSTTPTPTLTPTVTTTPGTPTTPTATATTTLPGGAHVQVSVTKTGADQLLVAITAAPGRTIQRLDWTLPANASATALDGTVLPTGVTLPAGTTGTSFYLRRLGGTSVTLPITVRGSFGEWRTFVGGGPSAW